MTITQIEKLNDGDPISSLNKSEITNIGKIKPGANGDIQFLAVKQNDKELKILLKEKRYFLDPEKYSGEGWFISILAGPPIKGIPVGLEYFFDGEKKRIVVTGRAGKMIISHADDCEVDSSQPAIPIADTTFNNPKPAVIQLTEKPVQKSGAHDARIEDYVKERIYIYRIVKKAVIDSGSDFPIDKLTELATSVHIEADRKGFKLLPPTESKPRIDAALTNGNNPETPVAKEVKTINLKKNKVDKPADPVEQTKKAGSISEWINGCAFEEWYRVADSKGNLIGEITQDDTRRAKVLHWYMSNSFSAVQADPATKCIWSAIKHMLDSASRGFQTEMIFEAMRFDQSKIEDIDYSVTNFERFDDSIVKIIKRSNDQAINDGKTNPFAFSKAYFDIDSDDRVA